jgi:LAO/AO transport system kinase
MKAGLMEIGDIFVINKSDREGVERLQTELEMLLGLATFDGGWVPKIVKTIATKKIGVDKLTEKLKEHRDYLYSANLLMIKGLQAAKQRFLDAYQELSLAKVISKNCEAEFQDILKSIYERKIDPYTAAEIFLKK